jgi:hypothetical protein
VSFTPRTYDQIVRDILTTLTGGTVRETVKAPAGEYDLRLWLDGGRMETVAKWVSALSLAMALFLRLPMAIPLPTVWLHYALHRDNH